MKRKQKKPGIPLSSLLDGSGFLTPADGASPFGEMLYDQLRGEAEHERLLAAVQAELNMRLAKGRMLEDKGRKLAKDGTAASIKYTDDDKRRWQKLAQGDDLRGKSKACKAGIIAHRLSLPDKAIHTIRKSIE